MGGGKPGVCDEGFDRLPGCEGTAVLQQDVLVVAHITINIIMARGLMGSSRPRHSLPGRLWGRAGRLCGGVGVVYKIKMQDNVRR